MKTYQVNKEGYYGEFGGAYIPEILHRCVEELKMPIPKYWKVKDSKRIPPVTTRLCGTPFTSIPGKPAKRTIRL